MIPDPHLGGNGLRAIRPRLRLHGHVRVLYGPSDDGESRRVLGPPSRPAVRNQLIFSTYPPTPMASAGEPARAMIAARRSASA